MFVEPVARVHRRVTAITRPRVVLGCCYECGANRVQVDVTGTREQVGVRVDQTRLEAPVPKCAGAVIQFVDVARLTRCDCSHESGNRRNVLARLHDEMYVIRHQTVGIQPHVVFLLHLDDIRQVVIVVPRSGEYSLPVMTALNDMQRHEWQEHSWIAWHFDGRGCG